MNQDREPSSVEAAYLQALVDAERGKPKRRKVDRDKSNTVPNLRHGTIADFKRQNSDEVAAQLATQIKGGAMVRRKTVHLEPVAVRVQDEEARALAGRLRTQAQRIGRSWSRWINDSRVSGWRNVDQTMANSWVELMIQTGGLELDPRIV